MTQMHEIIGNTVAEWDDALPLAWEMREVTGPGDDRYKITKTFDLTSLRAGYEDRFLLTFKNLLFERRKRIQLISVHTEFSNLRRLLLAIHQKREHRNGKASVIDHALLQDMRSIIADISPSSLYNLRKYFSLYRRSPLFASDLVESDFTIRPPSKGYHGAEISRILAKALNRAACVHILGTVEAAWEENRIDMGQYVFLQLAFHIFSRPAGYRQLTLADLVINIDEVTGVKNYILLVTPKKTGLHIPEKIPYSLVPRVGELLALWRARVIDIYGPASNHAEIGRLAMFPGRIHEGEWMSRYSGEHYGRATDYEFRSGYLYPITRLAQSIKFDFNALRHTVGTQLAQAGASKKTIQAVLKHANDCTCQAYVDIAFNGLIKELSDAMEPAFTSHFPVYEKFRSKNDPLDPVSAITSLDMQDGRKELTGECGRRVACQYAPLACYPCPRFIPCYDADHTANLNLVEANIQKYEAAGLPYQHLVKMNKEARLYILLVIAASQQYRNQMGRSQLQ